jgi:hypothetical protein
MKIGIYATIVAGQKNPKKRHGKMVVGNPLVGHTTIGSAAKRETSITLVVNAMQRFI